ncbi:hypothetical protein [Natrialba hulunbeirensis]|uniref:hypothetical protein n=1 Tax=Natrialba hulunbeirensis TaxID=123783 RepID=UPI001267B67D|nr:hypothetical protein [Natrialba hulunbeirensis]
MGEDKSQHSRSRRDFCRTSVALVGFGGLTQTSSADDANTDDYMRPPPGGEPSPTTDEWDGACYVNPSLYQYEGYHTSSVVEYDRFYAPNNPLGAWGHDLQITARSEFGRWSSRLGDDPSDADFAPYLEAQGINFDMNNGNLMTPSPGNMENNNYFGTSRPEDDDAEKLNEPDDDELEDVLEAALGAAPVIGDMLDYAAIADALIADGNNGEGYDFYWPFATGGASTGSGLTETTCTIRCQAFGDPDTYITGTIEATIWAETNFGDEWGNRLHTHEWEVELWCPDWVPDEVGQATISSPEFTNDEKTNIVVEDVDESLVINGEEIDIEKRVKKCPLPNSASKLIGCATYL